MTSELDTALSRLRRTPDGYDEARLRNRVRASLDGGRTGRRETGGWTIARTALAMRLAPAVFALVVGSFIGLQSVPRGNAELDVFAVRSPYSLAEITSPRGAGL